MIDFTAGKTWAALAYMVLVALVVTVGWAVYEVGHHNGAADYCYIGAAPGGGAARLYSHRPWACDEIVTSVDLHTPQDTIKIVEVLQAAANKIQCPIK